MIWSILGSIQFACGTGYVLDPTTGGLYTCKNGAWTTKPQCLSMLDILRIFIFYKLIF
jgi:hypothetical protein